MSTALYRRYRPETFADVIGQEHVTDPLMTALRKNRVNHAYLFSGPRGCGKTTSARILARCLNCAEGPTPTPCGVCPSCQDLARDGAGSLDVIEMDAASHGGVDHARDLRERATFASVRDRYKIFIIDEAHMVTREGFNALLKIVEEPPEHIKFIFATTEPNKVLGTIRSRTHHYPFRLVAPEVLRGYLQHLCEEEGIAVEEGVLPLVVRAGGGSVRDSLSVLDQLMAGAGENGITYDLAVALLGFTHAELLDGVVDAFAAGDSPAVFQAVDRVIQTGQDPRRFVEDLLERFRDLIIVRAVPESAASILHGMPADQIERMRGQAQQLGAAELSRSADITNTALTEMTGATSPQLHLELLCARILLPTAEDSTRGVGARVDRLERRINMGSVGAVQAPLQADPAALTTPETPAEHAATESGQTPEPSATAGDAREAALAMARRNRQVPPGQQNRTETAGAEPATAQNAEPADAAPTHNDAPRPDQTHQEGTRTAQPQGSNAGNANAPVREEAGQQAAGRNSAGTPAADQQTTSSGAPSGGRGPQGRTDSGSGAPGYSAQPTAPPDAGQVNMIAHSWEDVVAAVGKRSKVAQATFRECRPSRFENGVLFVTSSGPGIQSRVERYAGALGEALQETLGVSCTVAVDNGGGSGPSGSTGPNGPAPNSPGSNGSDGTGGPGRSGGPGGSPGTGRPQQQPPSPGGSASAVPQRGQQQASSRPEDDWPGQDDWNRAAQNQSAQPGVDATGNPGEDRHQGERPARRAGTAPAASEGERGDQRAWEQHGEPLNESTAWSSDAEGEDFSGWNVAVIPSDEAESTEEQPQVSLDHASATDEGQRPAAKQDPEPAPSSAAPQAPGATPSPAAEPDPGTAPDSAHPVTGSHLRVVRDDESRTTVQHAEDAGTGGGTPGSADASESRDPSAPRPATGSEAPGETPGAAEDAPAHDWSVAARQAGAPGRPVDGTGSGWGYSGPDGWTTGPGAEHPSRWGQRGPHLAGVGNGQETGHHGGNQTSPSGAPSENHGFQTGPETPRHLHAVPEAHDAGNSAESRESSSHPAEDDWRPVAGEPSDSPEFEESEAPEDHGYPTGPAVLEDEASTQPATQQDSVQQDSAPQPSAESSAPARGRGLSFRERHAAEIARGASGPSGSGGATPSAQESEEEWDDFVPEPDDEDIENSSVFGKAAVETVLGGRVIEERPHHQM